MLVRLQWRIIYDCACDGWIQRWIVFVFRHMCGKLSGGALPATSVKLGLIAEPLLPTFFAVDIRSYAGAYACGVDVVKSILVV